MGTKRIGLARVEVLMENLKREMQMNQSTLVGQRVRVKSLKKLGFLVFLTILSHFGHFRLVGVECRL